MKYISLTNQTLLGKRLTVVKLVMCVFLMYTCMLGTKIQITFTKYRKESE